MMKDGWAMFAEKIIAALAVYDKQHGTGYADNLSEKEGPGVLAEVMRKVDRASQWQPILKGPRTND